ncbi:MAG: DUF192 domain-containing protein [Fimbriimonadales bacterium]
MKNLVLALSFSLVIAGCGGEKAPDPVVTQPTPTLGRQVPLAQYSKKTITVKGKEISAYVADEQAERTEGLMFVKDGELGENEGMVFVFPNSQQMSFWMENTLIPLDIAYLDESGKILNIRQMEPLDRSPQPSAGSARYAVETNVGWFEKNGIKAGEKFDLSAVLE